MKIRDFLLERYFAKYEFNVQHLLSPSDCESFSIGELLKEDGTGMEQFADLRLSYTESRGNPKLLELINTRYGVGTDGLVVGCPEELIFLFLNSFLKAGDRVVCISPAYQSLYELPRSIGCEVVFWPLFVEKGCWKMNLELLESVFKSKLTRLLILNFPHNPTGYMPEESDLRAILKLTEKYGVALFSDEMYRGLEINAPSLPTLGNAPHAIALSGVSKSLGLPGLRLGWLASGEHKWIASVLALKDYTTICNSAPSEFLACAALRCEETLLKRNRALLQENNLAARQFFKAREDLFEWIPPLGGATAFPRLLQGNIRVMSEKAVSERSLMVLPDSVFDMQDNRFRVGMGRKNFPQVLSVFGEFLEVWKL